MTDYSEGTAGIHPTGTFRAQIKHFVNEGIGSGGRAWYDLHTAHTTRTDGITFPLRYSINMDASPKSATTLLRNAVAGRTLTKEELKTFDPADLIGHFVKATVAHATGQHTEDPYHYIESVEADTTKE